jgi:hypothetical protein
MNIRFLVVSALFLLIFLSSARSQGVSVSYLIPRDGYLSAPVSPFSIRGMRLPLTSNLGLQGGATFYMLPGLPVSGLPFDADMPLRGSTFGLLIPAQFYVGIKSNGVQVLLTGGVFGMGFTGDRLITGNWDRAFASSKGWEIANGNLSMSNRIGWGWITGLSVEIPVNRQFSISTGLNYLDGSAPSPISGEFYGANTDGELMIERISFDQAKTRLSGMEISLGISF